VTVVRAAGGVVGREGRVLLVHRPRYDDWTFPKGKADDAEPDIVCALREVREETGFRCLTGRELSATEYVDAKGRTKRVRWWLMRPLEGEGEFEPSAEVDEIRWEAPAAARALLTYERDVQLLAELV
jgi:8-oxo-dGTP pyrophosphatase MutT (NUDIX family)